VRICSEDLTGDPQRPASFHEAEVLSTRGRLCVTYDTEQAVERHSVLAQRDRVLSQDVAVLGHRALDVRTSAPDKPELLNIRFVGSSAIG
jgi:hypothetical protein